MNFLEHKSVKKVMDIIEENNLKDTVIAVVALSVALAGYGGYRWYKKSVQEKSFHHMTEVIESYKKSLDIAKKVRSSGQEISAENDPFIDIDLILQASQSASSGSSLSPIMLAYQAELTYEKTHDVDAARKLFAQASSKLSSGTFFHELFALKAACMGMDSADEKIKQQGIKELTALANDEKSFVYEQAVYTLGLHEFVAGNVEQAKALWMKIAHKETEDDMFVSPWAKKATQRVQALGIEI